jgi:CHAD domain-containing protein
MAVTQREREDKFAVGPSFVMPPLEALAPGQGEVVREDLALRSTYYDTVGHDLLRCGVTLRRREGDADEGWQLKVPDGKARTEIRRPLVGEADVPGELRDIVAGMALGEPLRIVAVVTTARRIQRIIGHDGAMVLEAADDSVSAAATGGGAALSSWREIELELGTGSEALLGKAGRRLRKAGAARSGDATKLGRALGAAVPGRARLVTAADVLAAYIWAQYRALALGDVALRRGLDPIHPTRVAARRLRSTLRVFAPMLIAAAADELDADLAWYAGLLGEVRDRQVQRERFAAAIAELPVELVLGPVAASIEQRLLSEQLAAREALMGQLTGPRYLGMLRAVAAWADAPRLARAGLGGARDLAPLARRAGRRAARDLRAALRPGADDAALHGARKAAKRARYAAEAAAPVLGRKAAKARIARFRAVQEVLGEHQDSLVAADLLRRMGAVAGTTPGQNGFTYGLLYAREQQLASAARRDAASLPT